MTATTTALAPTQQDTAGTEPSGADLARLMLRRARQDAKQRGTDADRPTAPRRPKKKKSHVQFHGRAPVGLAGAFQSLLADRGWDVPAAGGSILDRWPDIAGTVAPTLAAHTTAVAFDPATGQLDLLPDSSAYATQLRLMTPRIITAVNEHAPEAVVVRTVRVRQPGTLPAAPAPVTGPAPGPTPAGPVKTRDNASEGFRVALAAHHQVWTPFQQDPALADAVGRQEQVRRELAATAFPDVEQDQEGEVPTSLEDVRAQQRQANDAVRIAAILRARAERAGRTETADTPARRQAG